MPTGSAMARATPIENTVSMSVVGIRSSTRAEADWPWWKNDLPKLPVTALPTKRTNWTGSGSCRPSVRRRTARSASGASGMMSDTGSPLACRIANVTSETPVITTARRTSRRTRNEDISSQRGRDGPSDTSHGLGAGKAGARTRIRPLALGLGAETAPPTPPHGLGAGGAGARSGIRSLALGLGVEEPEPLVAAGGVLDALGDRQRVVLREQVDRRRLLADQLLDLRVRPLAGRLVQRRAALVDQLVQPLDPRVVLADPAARLRVEERVEHGVGVEDRVVAPRAVGAVGGLALGLQKFVPRRARVPHPRVRADADLGQHLGERLEDRPELDERAVQRDVDAAGITGLGQQLFGLLGIERERLDLRIVAKGRRLHDGGHLPAEPAHQPLDDGLLVDREVRGLPHELLVERRRPHVELDVVHAENRRGRYVRLRVRLERGRDVGRHVADQIHPARLDLGDLGGHLRDGADDEVLERGLAAPVAVEGLQADVLVALPLDELPRPRPDGGRGAERVVADLLEVLLGDDGKEDQPLEQERERLVGDEVNRVGVDDADVLDGADVAVLGLLLLLLAGLRHPLDRELHVLGGQRVAVVEL